MSCVCVCVFVCLCVCVCVCVSCLLSCTPRKVVPKMSNQIVGLKQAQEDDDDDDVADVFKL